MLINSLLALTVASCLQFQFFTFAPLIHYYDYEGKVTFCYYAVFD